MEVERRVVPHDKGVMARVGCRVERGRAGGAEQRSEQREATASEERKMRRARRETRRKQRGR